MEYNILDVFVLTYNRASYLNIMLESLCVSTATGFNIYVLNNCSTDNTLDIIKNIRKKYPSRSIKVITNKENLGNYGNFKLSQELASNKYTAIFHDDDAIHPQYIETAMKIFLENPDICMVSGNSQPLWNVSNNNWDLMFGNYYIYNKCEGAYYSLLLNRYNFACCIYKTSTYKGVKYHPEDFGKVHDIIFTAEISMIGSTAFILDICIRWRLSMFNDSNTFTNGPYPEEVAKTICRYKSLIKKASSFTKPLLFNFAYFLYKWANLKKYETWKEFKKRLESHYILEYCTVDGCFKPIENYFLNKKWCINIFNYLIRKRAINLGKKLSCRLEGRY